ncbi:MAG: lipid II flippase MurJ [Pseudomonadota bacterium]
MSTVFRATLVFSAAIALGRVIGFLREVLLAARLGVSAEADIAVVLVTLPDLLVGMFLTGGFTFALVPALRRQPQAEQAAGFRLVATCGMVVSGLLAVAVAVAPDAVFGLLTNALAPAETAPYHPHLRWAAASIPFGAAAILAGAWHNVRGVFYGVGLGTVVYTATICAFLLLGSTPAAILGWLTVGIVLAGFVRLGLMTTLSRPPWRPSLRAAPGIDVRFVRLFAAGVVSLGLTVLARILFRTIAGSEGEGALSVFAYAMRIYEMPVSMIILPLATVLLPTLSAAAAPPVRLLRRSVAAMLGLAVLGVILTYWIGEPVMRLLFQRGAMGAEEVSALTAILQVLIWALPFAAVEHIAGTMLNAAQRTGVLMVNTSVGLALGAGVALVWPHAAAQGFVLFAAVTAGLNVYRAGLLPALIGPRP